MKKNVPIHDLEENHDQPDVQFSMPVLRSNLNVMNGYSGISTVGSDGKFVPELRVFAGIAGIAILAGLTSILLFTKQLSTISSFEKVSLNYIGNVLALAPEALIAAVCHYFIFMLQLQEEIRNCVYLNYL